MPLIELTTQIYAPIERVFDLSRSIDAHTASSEGTSERAVAGRTAGLIEAGESVTWEARHFGIKQRLTVEIFALERPIFFKDRMIRGAFSTMHHTHRFEQKGDGTVMFDAFHFTAPLGVLGRMAEWLFLTRYMRNFLIQRNQVLKQLAETDEWRRYLG